MPSPSVESTTSAQHSALTSLRRIPAMKSNPAIHRIETPALEGDLVGLAASRGSGSIRPGQLRGTGGSAYGHL